MWLLRQANASMAGQSHLTYVLSVTSSAAGIMSRACFCRRAWLVHTDSHVWAAGHHYLHKVCKVPELRGDERHGGDKPALIKLLNTPERLQTALRHFPDEVCCPAVACEGRRAPFLDSCYGFVVAAGAVGSLFAALWARIPACWPRLCAACLSCWQQQVHEGLLFLANQGGGALHTCIKLNLLGSVSLLCQNSILHCYLSEQMVTVCYLPVQLLCQATVYFVWTYLQLCLSGRSAQAATQKRQSFNILRSGWSAGTAPCCCRAPAAVSEHALGHQQELHLLPQQPEHQPHPESGGSGDVWPRGSHRERPGVLVCQAEGQGELKYLSLAPALHSLDLVSPGDARGFKTEA